MTPTASPDNERSTHHVVLSGDSAQVGLILCDNKGNATPLGFDRSPIGSGSIKMFQGIEKYSDLDLPYESIAQKDFGGGRGSRDFDQDQSMYYDADGVVIHPRSSKIILGGMPVFTGGNYNNQLTFWQTYSVESGYTGSPINYYEMEVKSDNWLAVKLPISSVTFTPSYVYFYVRRNTYTDVMPMSVTVQIVNDSSGLPGTTVYYTGTVNIESKFFNWNIQRVSLTGSGGIVSGTQYWLKLSATGSSYHSFLMQALHTPGNVYRSTNQGSSWFSFAANMFYRITDTGKTLRGHFAEYKGMLFMAAEYDDGSPSKLFYSVTGNGVATGGSITSLTDTARSWATDYLVGAIVKLNRGQGSEQVQNWRMVIANTSDTLTVSPPWNIAPTAGTEYSLIGLNGSFAELTAFDANYDVVVKDILAANGALYFANGDSTPMIRLIAYNNAGAWTYDWSDLGSYTAGSAAETGQFTYLLAAGNEAGNFIWGAKGGFPAQLYKAKAIDCTGGVPGSPSLSFEAFDGANGNVGDVYERITGLIQYGEFGSVHVLKEGSVHRIYNGRAFRISTEEQRVSSDYRTGRSKTSKGSYLYFAWHDTVIRYYEGVFDNIGPNKGEEALPADRRGNISALVAYPGMLIAAIDAGTRTSSIMAYTDQGWHTLFVAPATGMRIQSLYIQSMPGDCTDRLWFTCGSEIMWLPLSVDPVNQFLDSMLYYFYPFRPGGYLSTSFHYVGMDDVPKFFKRIKLVVDESSSNGSISIYSYRNWDGTIGLGDTFFTTFSLSSSQRSYSANVMQEGERIAFIIAPMTSMNSYTPIINAVVLDAVKRFDQENQTVLLARLQDHDVDLLGQPDEYATALAKYNALATLQNQTGPVNMSSMITSLNGLSVFVDRLRIRPVWQALDERDRGNVERYLIEIALIDA